MGLRVIAHREALCLPAYGTIPRLTALTLAVILGALFPAAWRAHGSEWDRPHIIWIMADDLGYGELGCYGQDQIQTPNLDRMAAEGLRLTQFYAGSTVCAPSRCVLMTGRHAGHAFVRGNARNQLAVQALRARDTTVADVLHQAGYRTALIGKWGLGDADSSGYPLDQGFDFFFGYANQVHAHNYYPEFLWRDRSKQLLRNEVERSPRYAGFRGGWAIRRVDYSHDLFIDEALDWIDRQREQPFFLYLSLTIPHANNEATRALGNGAEVPDVDPYADRAWPEPAKGHAAMISRMDRDVGRLLALLRERQMAERTLVFFTSDNGPHGESGFPFSHFRPAGDLRGRKRDLYEGGIRVPAIAWWPGVIPPGGVSDHVAYFGDLMATACELAGAELPADDLDSISFVPTLTGRAPQPRHAYLYWEFYEGGTKQAVHFGPWKAIRQPMLHGSVELYDLARDPGEQLDLAARRADIVEQAVARMGEAHVPSPNWQVPAP